MTAQQPATELAKGNTSMKHTLATLMVLALAIATQLEAKDPHKTAPSKGAEIVGHIALNAAMTQQMFTRRDNKGRLYLYSLSATGQAVSVIDITDAAHPALISQVAYSGATGAGNVQTLGVNTELVEVPDQPAAPVNAPPAKNISLVDVSNPAAPHVTLRFAGVTAVARDDSRSLLFIANNEGIWVVRHYEPVDAGVRAWLEFTSSM
jgi:hypothetical protein